MGWEMDTEEIEAVLERVWDIHDKISDAIHGISRAHFLKSIKCLAGAKPSAGDGGGDEGSGGAAGAAGFVFVKGFRVEEEDGTMAEARSLNAIRTALENLEDQLEFFQTVQLQQRAERDAAIARLEQSRIILAMRLAEHQGKKYKVIEEARAFIGDVHDATGNFVSPENLFCENMEEREGKRPGILMQMLISSLTIAKKSLRLHKISGVLGNAALFAVSMVALLQLHQAASNSETPHLQEQIYHKKRNDDNISQLDGSSQGDRLKRLDVLSARG